MIQVITDTHKATFQKGRIELEALSQSKSTRKHVFPQKNYSSADITCFGLTSDFLVFANGNGSLFYFALRDEEHPLPVTKYCHSNCGISRIWLNSCASRLLFEDENHAVYIYNPLDDQVILVPEFTGVLEGALWDVSDNQVFVLIESCQNFVYLYSQTNIWCPTVSFLGASERSKEFQPLILDDGILNCKVTSGEMKGLILPTHQWKHKGAQGVEQLTEKFKESLALLHFKEAWTDALALKSTQIWDRFTQKALEHLEVEIAIKSCQQSKNIKMLPYLHHIAEEENRALLAGHIFLLFGDHDAAEASFLKSCCPEAALEMRYNLKQWDKALSLATELGISSLVKIKLEYAQLLERHGEYREALSQYESLLKDGLKTEKLYIVKAGIARASIHCGDLWKGRQMVMECADPSLYIECADIYEEMKLFEDAGELFELGGQLEKSFLCYITIKNFTKASSLLENLSSPKFYVEYAKAMEVEGNFADALLALEYAKDYENVVRLLLGPLQNPSKAYSVIHASKSVAGALNAAKFCKNAGDYARAIEFLILARRPEEARELAEQHDKMDVYVDLVIDSTSKEECSELAKYYETMGEYSKAGRLLERGGESEDALKLYLSLATNAAIEQAIDLVQRAKCEALSNQLFEFLKKQEGQAEENRYHLYMLHKALGNLDLASNIVSILAEEEQGKGNYKKAHELLLGFCLALKGQNKAIPPDIMNQLILVHSYVLAKISIRLGDHCTGAQLLVRVSQSIYKFPAHIVPILTSTVIECDRAGLSSKAFEFATTLVRPEYRNLISVNYKRKVEKLVRKYEKVEEKDPVTPCPFCSSLVPNMQLECGHCNRTIPFCIASGRHMIQEDWSTCPHCKFPALATEFRKIIQSDLRCPMCSQRVTPDEILLVQEFENR